MKNATVVFSPNFPFAVITNSNKSLRQVSYFGEATRKNKFRSFLHLFQVVLISINEPS